MEEVLAALRAAAEPTRLRLLHLCDQAELTVTELTQILGQSQPRVSRHLKLLCDAGLLSRFKEGSWAFFRVSQSGGGARLARRLLDDLLEEDDTLKRDLVLLDQVRVSRADHAAAYFATVADTWDQVRSLYIDDAEVEAALLAHAPTDGVRDYLDIGTGTGRILRLLAPRAERSMGIDTSHEMLTMARSNLDQSGVRNCVIRQGDLYRLPLAPEATDLVTIHQVLHYVDDPGEAIREAARVLRGGGRLIVVDFAPHAHEDLRERHAHRRLGFSDGEVSDFCAEAGLRVADIQHLAGDPLTVTLWIADKPADGSMGESGGAIVVSPAVSEPSDKRSVA